jgi:hypothetical protein
MVLSKANVHGSIGARNSPNWVELRLVRAPGLGATMDRFQVSRLERLTSKFQQMDDSRASSFEKAVEGMLPT